MKKLIKQFINFFLFRTGIIQVNRNAKIICMSGSPRSGTTFIAESVSEALGNCPMIWEPLQDPDIPASELRKLSIRPTWHEFSDSIFLQQYLKKIIVDKWLSFHNTWLNNKRYFSNLIRGNKDYLLIKFVRANGLLDIFENVSDKVVLSFGVVRNPFSVISSQIRHHEFQGHPAFSKTSVYIKSITACLENIPPSQVRDLAITWSVDYLNAIHAKSPCLYYEEILAKPEILMDLLQKAGVKVSSRPDTDRLSSTY